MEHEVRRESGETAGAVAPAPAAGTAAVRPASEMTMLRSFDEAIDRLGMVARDASALVESNGENLAFIRARNDRLERLVAVNQATLDRLVGAQPA